ncbi:MAG: hypothetical protein OXF98_03880 [Rhodospirillaceae bacterium]|nr:hypothetical protein [Rhodospirillaceae bacterium]
MSGAPDLLYVRARAALLDAAEALAEQLDAVVLVGAQAVYLHTGDADFAAAEYTTDADFCVAPGDLSDEPLLHESLQDRGFSPGVDPGAWLSPDGIPVDLMVPEALAGPGSRGARLGPHGKRVARRAKGLEGALIDRDRMEITSLDPGVERSVEMLVAGPAALLVAKVHKIAERTTGTADRVSDKDALDVLRLLQATDTATLVARLVDLADDTVSAEVAAEAVSQLGRLFGSRDAVGISMAVRAARADAEADVISASFTTLVSDLLAAYRAGVTGAQEAQ